MDKKIKAIETRYKGYRFRSRLEARWAVFFDAVGIKWEYEPEGYDLGSAGWYLPDFKIFSEEGKTPAWFEVKGKKATKDDLEKLEALCEGTGLHGFIASGTMGVPEILAKRKGRVDFNGSVIVHRSPEKISCPDKDMETYAKEIENTAICAFFQNGDGVIDIDHVYIEDTHPEKELSKRGIKIPITPKGKSESVDIVSAFSKFGGGVWLVDKVTENMEVLKNFLNQGSGRFYRSKLLKSSYEKARSARFEHGETP